MRKWLIAGGILLVLVIWSVSSYNGLVGKEADAKTAWSNVQSSYQRRLDLLDNLVQTVKGSAEFEKSTLTEVIQARANATAVKVDPSNITPEQLAKFQQAQAGAGSALSRLLVSVEQYPTLRTTDAFRELQSQIEGTENRINVTRDRYNEAVNVYDKKSRSFPTVIFARLFGFKEMARFQADAGAEKAPKINFDTDKK